VGEHENQIEEEGEVDHDEEAQSPISPAPERPGSGRGRAATGRRHGGFEEVRAWEKTRRERGEVGRVEVLTRARLGLVGRISPAGPAGLSPLSDHLAIYFIRINHLKE
jgi:hypothetical protein